MCCTCNGLGGHCCLESDRTHGRMHVTQEVDPCTTTTILRASRATTLAPRKVKRQDAWSSNTDAREGMSGVQHVVNTAPLTLLR
jgi:hypothetical protein